MEQYAAGCSLRQVAELTDRTQTAIRRALDEAGVSRRGRGKVLSLEPELPHAEVRASIRSFRAFLDAARDGGP